MCTFLVLVPFFSVLILNLPLKDFCKRIAFGLAAVLFLLQIALVLSPRCGFWQANPNLFGNIFNFNLGADIISKVVLLCIALVSFVALFVSRQFLKGIDEKFNFVNILLIATLGMNGVVLAKDIFSLYVFLEVTAASSFILIAFDKDALGLEGAFKYIILSAVATIFMLAAIALLLIVSGSTNFDVIHAAIQTTNYNNVFLNLALVLFLVSLFIKSGIVPFHGWLPDAYTCAPSGVSVFLAGIVTKVAGVYVLIRVMVSMFGFGASVKLVILFVGALSVVLGALAALTQSDFKRMLSYSSISQVGYIVLGLGSGTALGLAGAILHIFNHSVFKSLLFVNSASLEKQAGTRDIDKLGGLAKQMPLTGLTSVIASLSCAGIPPLAGFWSKLIIIIALWLAGYRLYAVIAVLGSVLTLAYFLSLQRRAFFGKVNEELRNIREAGFGLSFPAAILAIIILGAGLTLPLVLNKFVLGLSRLLGG